MFSIGLLGLQLWMSESCEMFIKKISGNKSRKDVREVKKSKLCYLKNVSFTIIYGKVGYQLINTETHSEVF